MPLVKRNIEPRHLCRGAVPDGVTSELECVTNSTLAAIIKQLGGLSRHAEDIFGELFNEANSFYLRMSSLQERVDLLAVKVTQLDSTVEEVSLQDINMRKAFKSSTIQDQQVVSRTSVPNPVVEMYHRCDKPPPLNILSPYSCPAHPDRPHSRQAPPRSPLSISEQQKQVEDPGREVKKVRKARNRRQEWNVLAYDKEFRPDARLTPSPYHGMSSEGSLSPDSRSVASDSYPASPNHPSTQAPSAAHPTDHHTRDHLSAAVQTQSLDRGLRPTNQPPAAGGVAGVAGAGGRHVASLGRTPSAHGGQAGGDPTVNGPRQQSVKDYRAGHGSQPSTIPEYYPPAPPPPPPTIPSAQTAFDSTSAPPSSSSASSVPPTSSALSRPYSPSPPPPPANYVPSPSHPPSGAPPAAPPPPPPGMPPGHQAHPSPAHAAAGDAPSAARKSTMLGMIPMSDARSDLLAAIRRGIQLRKVQEQREQEAKREPVGNDVATILSRRIAVEYSESDDDSELDENEWSD
ncbi:LOW QUALITY PROTEIN: actin-binding protein WASF3 [Diretmus argenteus]